MGVYLLNISVDAADPHPEHIPEDLTFNDQESIIEFLLEKVLGYEEMIAEYDDRDSEDSSKKNSKGDLDVSYLQLQDNLPDYFVLQTLAHPWYGDFLTSSDHQPDPPPPKA